MTLSPEWRDRIKVWQKKLQEHFYAPVGTIELEGFITSERLRAEEAMKSEFTPMPAGTTWGMPWEYAWFRSRLTMPETVKGERVVACINGGKEALVFVNGKAACGKSWSRELTLTRRASPGDTFDILAEFYAGHGRINVSWGPVFPGEVPVPEVTSPQQTVGESSYGIWHEELYQLWLDVDTLLQIRDINDPESLRVAQIDAGLRDYTTIADLELPLPDLHESVRAARKRLAPLLACRNGSTAATMYSFGHGHLDVAWLWPLAETRRKIARTMANQLALSEEYPAHRFIQSQPHLFMMLQEDYPELYKRVKEAVGNGNIIADGGMWVEADTNISGGESLIRQLLCGKRFFRDEFGIESKLLWLPDVFGYSAALPQILKGCGVDWFATAKIYWNFNDGDPFPHTTFMWEGIDGSQVLTHLVNNYNAHTAPAKVYQTWCDRPQKDGIWSRLHPYGFGDGGGGPTREHCEYLARQENCEGALRLKSASPSDFFTDLEQHGVPDITYVGELYFQAHRGVYTSQARTKLGNRASERALREAEMWAAVCAADGALEYPHDRLDAAWKKVLLNQFHDIIPGSSIARVYEDAEAGYAEANESAQEIAGQAQGTLVRRSARHMTVFNSLSWGRTVYVALPGQTGARTPDGNEIRCQSVDGTALAEVQVPSCGWTTLELSGDIGPQRKPKGDSRALENDVLRLDLDEMAQITRIYDKQYDTEYQAGPCNSFRMYKDVPRAWDAWDIDSAYEKTPVSLDEPASFELIATGPLVWTMRIRRTLNNSVLTQEIILRAGSRRVDFKTTVDWQETHKLLKVAFPVAVHADEAVHEIQFGHTRRPNHRSRPYDADRFEVCNHKWSALMEENGGCAVLNDCKYGVNVLGNTINLSLLRAPVAPDMNADKGQQEFTYAFYCWQGPFMASNLVREGYELNYRPTVLPGDAGSRSLFGINAPNVIIETVKMAEDDSRCIILRLYESMRSRTRCVLSCDREIAQVAQCSMLEEQTEELKADGNTVALAFRPFEIKTLRVRLR